MSDDIFQRHARQWLDALAQILKKKNSSSSPRDRRALAEALAPILRRASGFSEVSRHAAAAAAAMAAALLPLATEGGCRHSAAALQNLLASFPGSGGSCAAALERALLSGVRPGARLGTAPAAGLFALLPRLGGGGRDGAAHSERWAASAGSLLATLEDLMEEFAAAAAGEQRRQPSGDGDGLLLNIPPPPPKGNVLDVLSHLTCQVEKLSSFLVEMLETPFPQKKRLNLGNLVRACDSAANLASRRIRKCDADAAFEELANLHLPRIWTSMSRLAAGALGDCACAEDFQPYVMRLQRYLARTAERTTALGSYSDVKRSFVKVKCAWLDLLSSLVSRFGAGSGFLEHQDDLVRLLLSDVVPSKKTVKISAAAQQRGKRKNGGKISPSSSDSSGTVASPGKVAAKALSVLALAFERFGELISEQNHFSASAALLALAADSLRRGRRRGVSTTPPLDDPAARLELWRCLAALALHPNPRQPPPLNLAPSLMAEAERAETDWRASRALRSSLASLQLVARPRKAPLEALQSCYELSHIAKVTKEVSKVHVYVLRDSSPGPAEAEEEGSSRKRPAAAPVEPDANEESSTKKPREEEEKREAREEHVGEEPEQEKSSSARDLELARSAYAKSTRKHDGKPEASANAGGDFEDFESSSAERKELLDKFYDMSQAPIYVPEEAKNPPAPAAAGSKAKSKKQEKASSDAATDKGEQEEEDGDEEMDIETIKTFFVTEASSDEESS